MERNSFESEPKVSIIIPTFNRNNTLIRAIKSAISQTFQDFEILIIDDASKETPEKLIASFNDDRIKLFRHEFNKGANAARNTGIKRSLGDYIAFLDSDDEWLPEKLECQMNCFEKLPEKVGAHYSGVIMISPEDAVVERLIPTVSGDILSKLFERNYIGPLSSVIIRRSALDHSGFFDEKLPSSQDWDLYIRIAKRYHFDFVKKPLLRYHLSSDSITKNFMSKALGRHMVIKKYEEQMKKNLPALSRQLIKTGHYYCRAGLINTGRKIFYRAMLVYPLSLWGYFYFFGSLFGTAKYNQFVGLRHRLFGTAKRLV